VTPAISDSEDDCDGDELEAGLEATEQGHHHRHLPNPAHATTDPEKGLAHRFGRKLRRIWVKFNDFMTIPLWASLLSIVVALIQPLQHALLEHMPPVTGALKSAGNCSIPLTLVVLGAYFYPSQDEGPADGDGVAVSPRQEGKKKKLTTAPSNETLVQSMKGFLQLRTFSKSGHDADGETRARKVKKVVPGETKTVAIAVLSRMIITPMLLMPFVALASKFNLQEVFDEFVFPFASNCRSPDGLFSPLHSPVFVISNVLLVSSPPALTLAQVRVSSLSPDLFSSSVYSNCFVCV